MTAANEIIREGTHARFCKSRNELAGNWTKRRASPVPWRAIYIVARFCFCGGGLPYLPVGLRGMHRKCLDYYTRHGIFLASVK